MRNPFRPGPDPLQVAGLERLLADSRSDLKAASGRNHEYGQRIVDLESRLDNAHAVADGYREELKMRECTLEACKGAHAVVQRQRDEYGSQVDALRSQLQAQAAMLAGQHKAALHTADLLLEARQRANDLRAGMYGLLGLKVPGPMEYRIVGTGQGELSGALQVEERPVQPVDFLDYIPLPDGGLAVRSGPRVVGADYSP